MSQNDVFSALNIGSGMNTTELIQNLLTAERAPQEKKINDKIEKNEVSVSAIAELKKSISESSKTIDAMEGTNVFEGSSTSTSVTLTVTDPATVKEMSSSVSVSQLATSQTLVFDGFESATALVGDGDLLFQRGTWSNGVFTADTNYPERTVNISSSAYSLTDIQDKINNASLGVTAKVVMKDKSDYALVLRSNTGLANSFKISAIEGSNSGLNSIQHKSHTSNTSSISSAEGATITASSAHGFKVGDTLKYIASGTALNGLTSLSEYKIASVPSSTSFTLNDSNGNSITYGGSGGSSTDAFVRTNSETASAQNASFTIDGVTISRTTNQITDVVDGATLSLLNTTSSAAVVSVSTSKDKVLSALESLVEEVNNLASQLAVLTERGLNGGERGALASETTVRAISDRLKKITTEPIFGYGENPVYLANLGVSTTKTGGLKINERTFDLAFKDDPQALTALFSDRLHSSSSLVSPFLTGSNYKPGYYFLDIGTQATLTGSSPSTNITSSNYSPSSGNQSLTMTLNGVTSGTIDITGGPFSTTSALASALQSAINADNKLAVKGESVSVTFSNNSYKITSNKYGSKSEIIINSIDSGLNNYLGLQGGTHVAGTGGDVGASLSGSSLEQTATGFRTLSGDAFGLSMGVIAPGSDAYISIGNSYVSTLRNYFDSLLASTGALTTRTNSLNQELSDYSIELEELDISIEKSRERYKKQYGAMESIVNSFKSTGEFLDSYMEAQNKD